MSNLKRQVKEVSKAVINLADAWVDDSMGQNNRFLWGKPVNHPTEALNGTHVHTSYIVKIEGNVVETKQSIYNVLNWDGNKTKPEQKKLF